MLVGRFEKLLAAVVAVGLIWAGISSWTQRQPKFVSAGELITEPGRISQTAHKQ